MSWPDWLRRIGKLRKICIHPDHNEPTGCGNPRCWKFVEWTVSTPGAVRGYCNRDGCRGSFHVGGNYGSEVCYNPGHHGRETGPV